MAQKVVIPEKKIRSGALPMVVTILAFILLLVFIWLWYEVKITALEVQANTIDTSKIYINQ